MYHGLAGLASEGVRKLAHVPYYIVDAIAAQGVTLRQHGSARCLRPVLAAPYIGVGQEEGLQLG